MVVQRLLVRSSGERRTATLNWFLGWTFRWTVPYAEAVPRSDAGEVRALGDLGAKRAASRPRRDVSRRAFLCSPFRLGIGHLGVKVEAIADRLPGARAWASEPGLSTSLMT